MADPQVIIDAAMARNSVLSAAAVSAANSAMTAASGRVSPPGGYLVPANVTALRTAPPVFSPTTDLSTDFRNAYNEAFADFTPTVLASVVDYIARFFPAALATVVDDWIQRAIVTGGTGILPAIEAAIWERARSRDVIEGVRLEQEAMDQFASRGFLLPPGALAARALEVQRDAANKSSTIGRDVAIKAAELEVANVRFAVEQGLRVRLAVISGIGDYVRAWMKPAEDAVAYAIALVNAKEKLWNEASNYYNALVNEARMKLEGQRIQQGSRDAMVGYDVQSFTGFVDTQTKAALTVAQVIGQAAAGALNAIGVTIAASEQKVGPIP